MGKLIIVSNRLPMTAKLEGKKLQVTPSMGGLATGLEPVRRKHDAVWVGWPGDTARWSEATKEKLRRELAAASCVPVYLTAKEVKGFYLEFSNGVIWPLYHYLPSLIPLEMQGWDEYQRVNRIFAETAAASYEPGDMIWVHDFQLSLVPQMLRELLPEANIGYFLHIPFPSSEVFRILPKREELLRGMLGANVVGFHTTSYANNFASAALRVLGVEAKMDSIATPDGRLVHYGAFPLGVDVEAFGVAGVASPISDSLAQIRTARDGVKLLLAVDRLDYTKGIPRRLLAFERLLELYPETRGKVIMIQVAVPSRSEVVAYEENKRAVDEIVGRINGRFGSPGYHPIHYFATGFQQSELIQLYRGVDAMIVTPLRDGMNLVAKEFCAARTDELGVLVLSEFAGAANEMGEALIVNPYDLQGTAATYLAAIQMGEDEQRKRMRALRQRIALLDHKAWSESFLGWMKKRVVEEPAVACQHTRRSTPDQLLTLCQDRDLALFLDYDGTLVPITRVPELAVPDAGLRELLQRLAARPDIYLALVSGRSREAMDGWFGGYDIHLYAEHAAWERQPHGTWRAHTSHTAANWMRGVRVALDRVTTEVPGSFVEQKSQSLVWHYRMADPEQAAVKARELHFQLVDALANLPVSVTSGKKIVEVRAAGIHKGEAVVGVNRLLGERSHVSLAIGDDTTDEDMFRHLPPGGLSVQVGAGKGGAQYRLRDVNEVRAFLTMLAERPLSRPQPSLRGEQTWNINL